MTRIIALLSGVAILGLLGGVYYTTQQAQSNDKFAQCRASVIAGGSGQIGGDFTLVNGQGETVTSNEVIDQPSLIYFGYTFCPDVCPTDVARNAAAVDILKQQGKTVKPIFISIDPGRDTPEVVREFAEYMHPEMVGLTGSEEQVHAASQAYRTYYKKHEPAEGDEEFYLVDHTTLSYLTFPQEGFVEFFRQDMSPEKMAEQMACYLDAS